MIFHGLIFLYFIEFLLFDLQTLTCHLRHAPLRSSVVIPCELYGLRRSQNHPLDLRSSPRPLPHRTRTLCLGTGSVEPHESAAGRDPVRQGSRSLVESPWAESSPSRGLPRVAVRLRTRRGAAVHAPDEFDGKMGRNTCGDEVQISLPAAGSGPRGIAQETTGGKSGTLQEVAAIPGKAGGRVLESEHICTCDR